MFSCRDLVVVCQTLAGCLARPVGHGWLSSVTHLSLSLKAWSCSPKSQLWLPEGPPLYSEPVSKQGRRPHFRRPEGRERGELLRDCFASLYFGYISIVRGSALSMNPFL